MRREASRLWEQSLYDLDTAEKLLRIETYYASVFFSEQAAEKALKALHIERKRRMEFTHDLIELAEALEAPPSIVEAAVELGPDYVISRYPNAANAVPARLYNAESAQRHLGYAQGVIGWVKRELGLET
jgi:HEPN domain-containing protein